MLPSPHRLTISVLVAFAIYAASVAGAVALARRFVAPVSTRAALLLAVLPLAFTGRAFVTGSLYGPVDLYPPHVPWSGFVSGPIPAPANPILSDLAFANIPWRAAVRESVANGRFPFWNRFVLAGSPLLASAQPGVFHPSTFLGLPLSLALSWTFSCTLTIFLALLAGFLCFRDFVSSEAAALVGAAGWGFSTYILFWAGWSVGPSTATFPLLVLALRRIARGERHGIALAATSVLLSLAGGHPESLFHTTAAAGAIFVADLLGLARLTGRRLARPVGAALAAGALATLLAGPQLFPLLAAIPHSAEYRERSTRLAAGASSQSVLAPEASRRLLPALLPFAHGIYGRSPVQAERGDGSGMPLAYAGSILFPLAGLGLLSRRRGVATFGGVLAAGLLLGASFPGLLDLLTKLPGFALALNYRLVFLVPFGLAGLAALGAEAASDAGRAGSRRLAVAALVSASVVGVAAFLASAVFRDRALPSGFLASSLAAELVPLAALALLSAAAAARAAASAGAARPALLRALIPSAVLLLVVQRPAELAGVYPAEDAAPLTSPAATLDAVRPAGLRGGRVVAAGYDLRPNGSALLGLEDVRGYESIVLDRFADTYPLWCVPQAASFNRVDDLTRPFLSFLGARFAVAGPDADPPAGWTVAARTPKLAIFENPRALPRAFAPRSVAAVPDPLSALATVQDYSETAWIAGPPAIHDNPPAHVDVRTAGPDVVLDVDAPAACLVATSVPDWPGWRAEVEREGERKGAIAPELVTVNHAFVGLRVPPGRTRVRLVYRPPGFREGVVAWMAGFAVIGVSVLLRLRRRRTR